MQRMYLGVGGKANRCTLLLHVNHVSRPCKLNQRSVLALLNNVIVVLCFVLLNRLTTQLDCFSHCLFLIISEFCADDGSQIPLYLIHAFPFLLYILFSPTNYLFTYFLFAFLSPLCPQQHPLILIFLSENVLSSFSFRLHLSVFFSFTFITIFSSSILSTRFISISFLPVTIFY